MSTTKIKHVMTFTGYLPDDAMKQAKVLGDADVHAARDTLSEALKKAGVEHVVVSKIHREKPKDTPAATVAQVQEPDSAPEAEAEARHGRRAAA